MALIIEDGTIVVGANSYVTVAEAKAYAISRGENFPTVDTQIETLLYNAMDYVEAYRSQFSGQKVETTQATQWPRLNVTIDGNDFPSDQIPNELKQAQCQLAVDKYAIGDLTPSTDGYAVSMEKVDVIEVQYASGGRLSGQSLPAEPTFPKADTFLEPLLKNSGSVLTVLRI